MGLPDQVVVPYVNGYDFGIGINYSTGGPRNKAVTGEISTVEGAPGSTVRFQVRRVETTSDLEEMLDISVQADYGIAAFGAGASARFDFARSAKVQFSSLVMTVTATVERAFEQNDEPGLTPAAASVAGQPALFEDRFGNMFVRGVSKGGLFIGYIRIDTGSSDLSQTIAAELSGSYGLFSAEAEVKFKSVQRNFKRDIAIDMYHEGGPVDLVINAVEDPLELLRNVNLFLKSFQERPHEVARAYSVTFAPLTIANGPAPPNEIDLQHAQDVLIFCAKRRSVLVDRLNAFQYILDRPDRFDFSNGAVQQEVERAAETAQLDLDLIARCASRAMSDPGAAKFPEGFAEAEGMTYPQLDEPSLLPLAKPLQLPGPNAMPNLIGRPAGPLMSLLACINLEDVDHCLNFLGSEMDALGGEARMLAEFFFVVLRSGARFELHGDPNPPGAVIRDQFPPEGVEVVSGAEFNVTI